MLDLTFRMMSGILRVSAIAWASMVLPVPGSPFEQQGHLEGHGYINDLSQFVIEDIFCCPLESGGLVFLVHILLLLLRDIRYCPVREITPTPLHVAAKHIIIDDIADIFHCFFRVTGSRCRGKNLSHRLAHHSAQGKRRSSDRSPAAILLLFFPLLGYICGSSQRAAEGYDL